MKFLLILAMAAFLSACSGIPMDPSPSAIGSGDKTLIHGICKKSPGAGVDMCRVIEGSKIEATWTIYLPWDSSVIAANVRVRFKDKVSTFTSYESILEIPLKEVVGEEVWNQKHDGPIQAIATLELEPGGPKRYVQALGYAYVVVLSPGYSPLPFNDAHSFGKLHCWIEYTDAGRSSYSCSR